jgi:hypothetical protein
LLISPLPLLTPVHECACLTHAPARHLSCEPIIGRCIFKGSYSPYWSGKKNIIHSRELEYKNKRWTINDVISGEGVHSVSNFIHIHPDVDCVKKNGEYFLIKDANKLAKITFSDTVNISEEAGWYYPEFGIKIKNTVLRLSTNGLLPIKQSYVIDEVL